MLRYERKYRIENVDLATIFQVVRMHPAGLSKIFPHRQINNIYFDTPQLTTYKENVMGISNRKKYRVRWYGYDPLIIKKPQLEIKIRNNEVGSKKTIPVAPFDFSNLEPLTQEINKNCHPAFLQPVLQNSYKRAYFGTTDKKFRVTIDWDLSYCSLLSNQVFTKHQYYERGVVVIEIKYDKNLEEEANRISQFLPFRRTKNSKYVCGVEYCI